MVTTCSRRHDRRNDKRVLINAAPTRKSDKILRKRTTRTLRWNNERDTHVPRCVRVSFGGPRLTDMFEDKVRRTRRYQNSRQKNKVARLSLKEAWHNNDERRRPPWRRSNFPSRVFSSIAFVFRTVERREQKIWTCPYFDMKYISSIPHWHRVNWHDVSRFRCSCVNATKQRSHAEVWEIGSTLGLIACSSIIEMKLRMRIKYQDSSLIFQIGWNLQD